MYRTNSLQQAQKLTKGVKIASQSKANVLGSEVSMGMFLGQVPKLPSITYTLDNTGAGGTRRFMVVGDPTGMIAQLVDTIGGGVLNPTAVQGNASLVAPNKNFFYSVGVIFGSINYQTSSTDLQFAQPLQQHLTNMGGNLQSDIINTAAAQRNTAQNAELLTLTGEFYVDVHRGITCDVLDNEIVNLTLTPSSYTV